MKKSDAWFAGRGPHGGARRTTTSCVAPPSAPASRRGDGDARLADGQLFLAVTPRGLVCVAFEGQNPDAIVRRFAWVFSPRVLTAVAR